MATLSLVRDSRISLEQMVGKHDAGAKVVACASWRLTKGENNVRMATVVLSKPSDAYPSDTAIGL